MEAPSAMNIAVVVNTKAGGGRAKRLGESIARELTSRSMKFTQVRESSSAQTLDVLERIHTKDPFSGVISVGGDGLAHLLFPFVITHHLPIFVAPGGTGNDFSRSTGTFGLSAVDIVNQVAAHQPRAIDMGIIEHEGKEIWFGQVLSTGFDSLVNERANSYRFLRGKIKYLVAIVRELPFFVPRTYRVTVDGNSVETGSMLVAIANGKSYGGGMLVCPDASFADGLFDVLLLKPIPVREFLRVFPKVFKGTHISHPAVEIRRCTQITLESKAVAYADGERIGSLPISARIVPRAMLTWLPQ